MSEQSNSRVGTVGDLARGLEELKQSGGRTSLNLSSYMTMFRPGAENIRPIGRMQDNQDLFDCPVPIDTPLPGGATLLHIMAREKTLSGELVSLFFKLGVDMYAPNKKGENLPLLLLRALPNSYSWEETWNALLEFISLGGDLTKAFLSDREKLDSLSAERLKTLNIDRIKSISSLDYEPLWQAVTALLTSISILPGKEADLLSFLSSNKSRAVRLAAHMAGTNKNLPKKFTSGFVEIFSSLPGKISANLLTKEGAAGIVKICLQELEGTTRFANSTGTTRFADSTGAEQNANVLKLLGKMSDPKKSGKVEKNIRALGSPLLVPLPLTGTAFEFLPNGLEGWVREGIPGADELVSKLAQSLAQNPKKNLQNDAGGFINF